MKSYRAKNVSTNLLYRGLPLFFRQHVNLVEDKDHFSTGDLADNEALSSLGLDAFGDIDDQEHDINDLSSPDDGADERGMARAIHKSILDFLQLKKD